MSLSEKVVLVTGASSGIGAASAKLLSSQGYKNFALVARREKELNQVAEECRKLGAAKVIVRDSKQ